MWPGTKGFAPSTWVAWLNTGDPSFREQALPNLAARSWALSPWTWQSTISLRQVVADRWFAVTAFFDADGHEFKGWYVDFERPPLRRHFGIDTRDLFIDLIVNPDFSLRWKDEEEYERAIALGLMSEAERGHIEDARAEALELVGSRELQQGAWHDWRLDDLWDPPILPEAVLEPITQGMDGA